MHDRDSDKELTEMIARATSVGPIPRRLMTTAAERTLFGTLELEPVPGTDLVPYEPAGEVATLTDGGVPDTASLAHFRAVVMKELDDMWRTRRDKPLTFRTPEYKVEVENVLVAACDELDAALAAT